MPETPGVRSHWRWLLYEIAPHRRFVVVLTLLSLAEVALRMLLPWPLKAIIDATTGHMTLSRLGEWVVTPFDRTFRAMASPPIARLSSLVVIGFLISLAHQLVLMIHTRRQARLGLTLVRDLREHLFEHLQALALIHHDRQPTGTTVHRLDSDAACIEQLLLRGVFPFTFSALTLFAMLVVLMFVDWRLAIASMAIVPGLLIWMRRRAGHIGSQAQAAREAESQMVSHLYENFSAIRLVKSFARETHERGRFSMTAGAVMDARLRSARQDAIFALGVGLFTAAGTALVLLLGGREVLNGTSSPGTLLLALTYLGFVYGPLSGLANTTSTIQQALAGAERVHQTLRIPREDHDPPGAIEPGPLHGAVTYERVSFAYEQGRPVLTDVSFDARRGQMIAVVGRSGSGKTTLLSLLPRFLEPASGRVLIDGVDIQHLRLAPLRRQIAVVSQEGLILSGSVADNLRYGRLDATDSDLEAAARLANAHEFIVTLEHGYRTVLFESGRRLSGGQKQRLSIARAFVKDAPVVVLDEPTSALDPIAERQVVEALDRLRSGRTTFVIAHRLSTVRNADVIVVMDAGQIVASGTHDSLMDTSPLYRELGRVMTH